MEDREDFQIQRILFQYDLVPRRLWNRGSVLKVETSAGFFALKRKKMTDRQVDRVYSVYPLIRSLVIDAVGPLPSKYGDLVVGDEAYRYYLMPWFEETVPESDLEARYRHLFHKAGELHRQTMREGKGTDGLYRSAFQMVATRYTDWEQFLNMTEHHLYPSPFEQMVMSYSGQALGLFQHALGYFSERAGLNDDASDDRPRRALCHGRLSPLHLLIEGEKRYLTNFEEAREDFFIIETAALMEQACSVLPPAQTPWQDLLSAYFSACPLNEAETNFLFHFLLWPRTILGLMDQYRDKERSELWYTRRFQRLSRGHRRMINQLQTFIEQKRKEKQKSRDKEEKKNE
ncbi:spore coat protein YsxE [Sporolactobacillus sp. THM7-7]|nr:spore coat protein YsxE [Sporolactobacillus sp. THM7-7]